MATYRVEVEIKPWPEGGYLAEVHSLQGCWCVSETIGQAVEDIAEVIEMSIVSRRKRGEPLPPEVEVVEGEEPSIQLKMLVATP